MTWPLAVGHGPAGTAPPRAIRPLADNAAAWPAGQLFSSAPEFARFCIAFMDGGRLEGRQALASAVIAQMSAPHVAVPNEDRHYGYGLSLRREDGVLWLSHGGSRTGYGSLVRMCPERRFAVIILCNKTGASLPRVADHAAQFSLGRTPSAPPPRRNLTLSAEEIARYAGTYSNGRATIVLRAKDDQLVTAQGAAIRAIRECHFVREATAGALALEFSLVADADGRITHLMARGRAWRKLD